MGMPYRNMRSLVTNNDIPAALYAIIDKLEELDKDMYEFQEWIYNLRERIDDLVEAMGEIRSDLNELEIEVQMLR